MFSRSLSALAFAADFPPVAPEFHQRTHRVRLRNLGTTDKKSSHKIRHRKIPREHFAFYWKVCYSPIFDSQIYQNTAESLILPGFFSGAFSFYYIVFFLNQIWMIDFYDFSRDCLLSFWISFIFLLVRNS